MALTAISLYTGVGGLDFGFEAAGFRTAVAIEMDPVACRTVRLNRKRWPILEGDIHTIASGEILSSGGLRRAGADVLIGGPPCQPFSKSSYWVKGDSDRLDDPRSGTLAAYLRVLRDTRPRAFLLENVFGMAYEGKDEGLRYILDGVAKVNREAKTSYSVSWRVLNAADFGVPQLRERVFVVGARDGRPFRFPDPTHRPVEAVSLLGSLTEPYRTAWDAIGDLPQDVDDPSLRPGGKWGDLLPTIPEGENYLWHTPRGNGYPLFGWRTRYWSFLLKLAKAKPSWTIQAQPGSAIGPFHWRNRRLSSQEMCRIQTFPDGLHFECGRSGLQRLVGNAVPSLLAEVLAREIRNQLLDAPTNRRTPKLLPPARGSAPEPEPASRLPRRYRHLIGDHPPHPGEGKGKKRRANAGEQLLAF